MEHPYNVYISVPIHGRDHKAVLKDIEEAKNYAKPFLKKVEAPIRWVTNYDYEIGPDMLIKNARVCCLGEAIKKMSACDFAVFSPEAMDDIGCLIEKDICDKYKIDYYNGDAGIRVTFSHGREYEHISNA